MKKFFVRCITSNSDRVFLKPMTIKEYISFVNEKIIEKRNYTLKMAEFAARGSVNIEEFFKHTVKRELTFEYYPIPCEKYKSACNVWINTENLPKYEI